MWEADGVVSYMNQIERRASVLLAGSVISPAVYVPIVALLELEV